MVSSLANLTIPLGSLYSFLTSLYTSQYFNYSPLPASWITAAELVTCVCMKPKCWSCDKEHWYKKTSGHLLLKWTAWPQQWKGEDLKAGRVAMVYWSLQLWRNSSPYSEKKKISSEEVLLLKVYQAGLWLYYVLLSKA